MTTQDKSTTEKVSKPRAQLAYALIDVDFDDNPKIIDLAETHGELAVWFLVKCLLKMSRASHALVTRCVTRGIARRMGIEPDKADEIIEHCLKLGIMFLENDQLTNSRVIEDQEKLAQTRINALERQNKHRLSRVTNALPTRSPVTVTDTGSDLNSLKGVQGETLRPPGWLPDAEAALQRWIAHRIAKNRPLGATEIEALCSSWHSDLSGFIRAVGHCASNGHFNLYPVAERSISNNSKQGQFKTRFEKNMEILEASNERHRNKQALGGAISSVPKLSDK